MKKRNVALLLAAVMVVGSLAGCGGGKSKDAAVQNGANADLVAKEGYPVVEETISLSALGYGEPGCGEWEEFPILQELEAQSNIDVTWQTISGDGATEKLNLILASSKQLPDMVFSGLNGTQISQYADKGVIRPMEDLIDGGYAPNLKKILDENPDIRKAITMPDGHIYAIPAITENEEPVMTTTLNINKAWCDALGINPEEIVTIEDFENMLKRFAEEDPNGNGEKDEIPFTFEATPPYHVWNGDADLSGAFGVMTDWDPIMVKDGKIVFSQGIDEYKDYIKWFASLYSTGLIDKEVFTHDHNQYMAKIDGGNVGAYLTNGPVTSASVEYVAIAPLEGPAGRLWGAQDFSLDKNRGLITTACEYPEAAMRFMDSFYEPVTSLRLEHGIYLEEKDGKYEILPNESGKPSQAPGAYVGKNKSKAVVDEYLIKTQSQIDAAERQAMYQPYLMEPLPLMNYTPEESDELSKLSTDITKIATEQKAKWCTGQGDIDAEWDAYLESLNKVGLERYMEIHNAAYERYNSN